MGNATTALSFSNLVETAERSLHAGVDCTELLQRIRSAAAHVADKNLVGDAYVRLGEAAKSLDRSDEAEECFKAALRYARQAGNELCRANATKGLGDIALYAADEATQEVYDYFLSHKRERELQSKSVRLLEAEKLYKQAIQIFRDERSFDGMLNCLVQLSTLTFYEQSDGATTSKDDSFKTYFADAEALIPKGVDPCNVAALHGARGLLALKHGELQEAEAHLEEARDRYEQVGSLAGVASCLQGLGAVAYTREDKPKPTAAKHWRQARSLFKQLGDTRGALWCSNRLSRLTKEGCTADPPIGGSRS